MRRPFVPAGRSGLLILAFAAVPLVLSKCKPLAKKVGEKLVEWGEGLKTEAEKPDSPVAEESSSNAEMKQSPSEEETLKSSSPTGKEEVKEQVASQAAPKKTPPKPKPAAKKKAAPAPKAGTTTNPKKPTKQ